MYNLGEASNPIQINTDQSIVNEASKGSTGLIPKLEPKD